MGRQAEVPQVSPELEHRPACTRTHKVAKTHGLQVSTVTAVPHMLMRGAVHLHREAGSRFPEMGKVDSPSFSQVDAGSGFNEYLQRIK